MSDFQVQNNLLTGPIDPSFFDTPHLEIFLVDENLITDNKMHGTIPVDVGSLTELYNFKIDTNSFSGTLPEGMQHWHKLSEIYLQVTNIGGTLPDWIGNWVNITQFIAYDTQFHGTLPSIITSLKGLEKIYLYQNQFHGTLPSTWRHMEKLLQLLLHDNDFTGSIPPDLCHVQYIRSLQLDNNRLNGTIPHCFNESRYLQTLQFYGNELTGSIPPTITDIPYLEFLEIATNYLTGSIPDGFANISTLIEFSAYNNLLTGPLPVNMDRMPLLDELYLAYNLLSGPVPLPSPFMAKVSLRENSLYGVLPLQWWNASNGIVDVEHNELEGDLTGLLNHRILPTRISISRNQFTGRFLGDVNDEPVNGGYDPVLFINASYNYFTGTISPNLSKLKGLLQVYGSSNLLTGTLPAKTFTTMRKLNSLEAEQNLLTGSLPDPLVNTTADFFILNINSNSFTGTVPDSIFAIDNLQSVVLSLNCFSGTLPATLCDSEGLVDLLMDGLHASPRCHYERFLNTKFHVDIFESAWQVHGSIPTCVWQLPNLQVLHLSGNSLQGSITLPTENVLVSFNQTIGWNKHIEITANESVAFVGGQEKEATVTPTASSVAGGLDGAAPLWTRYTTWMAMYGDIHGLRDGQIAFLVFGGIVLQRWIVWLRVVMAVVVFVGMPLFVLLSTFYGTYDHQYIWTVSATFLSGPVPAALLLVFFVGLIAIVVRMNPAYQPAIVMPRDPNEIAAAIEEDDCSAIGANATPATSDGDERSTLARDTQAARPTEAPSSKSSFVRSSSQASDAPSFVLPRASSLSWHWPTLALNTAFILANIVVVVSVNAAYIVAINHQYDGTTLVFISLALSLFKIAWGALLTFFYQRVLHHDDENEYTLSLISLTIFNSIVAPYLADMIISPDCFKYALQSPPAVTSTAAGVPCYYLQAVVYQDFANVEITSYDQLLASSSPSPPPSTENPLHTTVADGGVPIEGHVQERNGGARDPASPLGLVDASIVAWNLSLLETSLLRKPLNPAQQLRVIVARDFAVLLTFGVLFPPLLVIIALAMVVQIHMIQMLLGRLHAMTPSTASPLTAATRSYGHRLQQWLQKANLSFADFDRGLWQGLAMSVSVAAVFWSLSLFDILADSDGGNNAVHAVWILMVMATAPFWMYALDVAWRRGSQRSWGCPLLLRWPLPQPAQSAGDVGTTASASASATVGDDDGMAVDGDDIEMRSTRGTASTRATLSTVHLRPSEAPSFSARTSTATLPPACVQLPPSL
eukprot:gene11375-8093_t